MLQADTSKAIMTILQHQLAVHQVATTSPHLVTKEDVATPITNLVVLITELHSFWCTEHHHVVHLLHVVRVVDVSAVLSIVDIEAIMAALRVTQVVTTRVFILHTIETLVWEL